MTMGEPAQVFVMPSQQLLAGGAGGGDEPRYPWNLKSVHEVDAIVVRRKKPTASSNPGPFMCPICKRPFSSEKAVHGHMRCHPERAWRGMEAPRLASPYELAADGKRYRYMCERCKAPFETRQALGGHRASHSSKKGCSWHSKNKQHQPAKPKFSYDLNEPAPDEE